MTKIGIIGLGWLGKPLAENLQKKSFLVKGTTTSSEKKLKLLQEGFNAYQLTIEPGKLTGETSSFLEEVDELIINIPPNISLQDESSYVKKIHALLKVVEQFKIKNILYISSTSVFLDTEDSSVYNEKSKTNARSNKAKQLIEAEQLIMNNKNFNASVIRFGGLVGGKRHPIHYLSGKQVNNPNTPVNLIHLKDCIELISAVLMQKQWNYIFHGVKSIDQNKSNFYNFSAAKRKLMLPAFSSETNSGKKIKSEFTQTHLGISFHHDVS